MLMNKRKYHLLIPLLVLGAVSMVVLASGAEPEAAQANTPSADQSEKESPEAAEVVRPTPGSEEKEPSGETASPRVIKEFKPTDKIEADSAVSFPIDI